MKTFAVGTECCKVIAIIAGLKTVNYVKCPLPICRHQSQSKVCRKTINELCQNCLKKQQRRPANRTSWSSRVDSGHPRNVSRIPFDCIRSQASSYVGFSLFCLQRNVCEYADLSQLEPETVFFLFVTPIYSHSTLVEHRDALDETLAEQTF